MSIRLLHDDAERFKDLCDHEWDGCTYKDGFHRLLVLAGLTPSERDPNR